MIKELSIESIRIGAGGVVAEVGLKTERGLMGMSVALKLKEEPELSELVVSMENAIEAAIVRNLALGTPVEDSSLS